MDNQQSPGDFHVLVIGAGSVGCLIAQRCKLLNIRCTLFEREKYLNERPRDWNFAIHHAKTQLDECLPDDISERLTTTLVNPIRGLSAHDVFPLFNAGSGELLAQFPTPNVARLSKTKCRTLFAEGLEIQYSKRLNGVVCSDGGSSVTAKFEDGTAATGNLLIGADGANSKVREYLLGQEKAALQPLSLLGCHAVVSLPAEVSRSIGDVNDLWFVGYHPEGMCIFMALHDISDPSKPETWKWMFSLTWPDQGSAVPKDHEVIRQEWTSRAKKLAEPFRSAYLGLASDAAIWCERLTEWRTVPWDNRQGRVTLAGDSAHPMTYHRGQGLNNGVLDAAYLCQALNEHCRDGKPITEALAQYEGEMQERGRAAVIDSGENSMMVHDWEKLKTSPIFTRGLQALKKSTEAAVEA